MQRRVVLAVVVVLVAIQAVLLIRTARDKSDTWDEPDYVTEAGTLWVHGDRGTVAFLPKWGFALAMRLSSDDITRTPEDPQTLEFYGTHLKLWKQMTVEGRERALFAARLATIVITLLGGLMLWRTATRWGPDAGWIALVLWVFSPTVLANGCLATMDAWVAVTVVGVIYALVRALERPTATRAAVLGVAMAAAAATKITALGVCPFALILFVVARARAGAGARQIAAHVGAVVAGGFLALWAMYRFTFGVVERLDHAPLGPLPFPAWWQYTLKLLSRFDESQYTYFMGETIWHGSPWFYAVGVAVKTTIGAQVLALARLVLVGVRQPDGKTLRRELTIDALLLVYPVLLFVAMSRGESQANIMYILPAFPFVMLWLSRIAVDATRVFGARGRVVIGVLLFAGAVESVSVHPHHLMFFNRWAGGPAGGWRYLIDRDDWGQDKKRLGAWQREHGVAEVFYKPHGEDYETWGVRPAPIPCAPTPGVYAIHADVLLVEMPEMWGGMPKGCLNWLSIEPPDERLGWSIWIWRVDEARIARLAAKADDDRVVPWREAHLNLLDRIDRYLR